MTKKEALHELAVYMHDAKAEAKREGFKVDRTQVWEQFVQTWLDDGKLDAATAADWLKSGPRWKPGHRSRCPKLAVNLGAMVRQGFPEA